MGAVRSRWLDIVGDRSHFLPWNPAQPCIPLSPVLVGTSDRTLAAPRVGRSVHLLLTAILKLAVALAVGGEVHLGARVRFLICTTGDGEPDVGSRQDPLGALSRW